MGKYHINKHGVPAPCKATKGNCPLGGEEQHFDSQEAAEEYAYSQNSQEFGVLPGVSNEEKFTGDDLKELSRRDYAQMEAKQAKVTYDGKVFEGEVLSTHYKGQGDEKNGIIVKAEDGQVKHIKQNRIENLELSGQGRSLEERGDYLVDKVNKDVQVADPELRFGEKSIRSIDDLDTLIELNNRFVTSQEHDPVKNVQGMFDHVANKSGKLYRYDNKANPYLETYPYSFERNIGYLNDYLNREDYFNPKYLGEEEYKQRKIDFEGDLADHRKLHNYTENIAIEYGKHYEQNVVLSGKYNFEEQESLKDRYKADLVDKVSRFVETDEDLGW